MSDGLLTLQIDPSMYTVVPDKLSEAELTRLAKTFSFPYGDQALQRCWREFLQGMPVPRGVTQYFDPTKGRNAAQTSVQMAAVIALRDIQKAQLQRHETRNQVLEELAVYFESGRDGNTSQYIADEIRLMKAQLLQTV
ncbi:hypothetical protein [Paraburkholderia sp. BCC1886]|uniref:hypothetical protein n=1 Tax=Paraburkholderia sp. BCC1886 TaxID=2562670 RepID=UPI0011821D67|nr:hypothetical protein [Paraburkholderia sp. BCC1886]